MSVRSNRVAGGALAAAGLVITAGVTVVPAAAAPAAHPSHAVSRAVAQGPGGGWAASDVLGQPNLVSNTQWDGRGSHHPGVNGYSYNQGTALDAVHHRLFTADCGDRVDVFQLDSNNNLISHSPSWELGQPSFTVDTSGSGQSGLNCPVGPSYDPVLDRLFVPDDGNNRVLVYDLSHGITNGMNAAYVLGQPNFTSTAAGTSQSLMNQPYGGSVYDTAHSRLIVSDSTNRRVLIWDLSGGIANGMNATYVLGQATFATKLCVLSQSGMGYPYGLAYDSARQFLFVADDHYGSSSSCLPGRPHRVLVFDLSHGISNGMNASYVIGEPDFTTSTTMTDRKAAIDDPEDLAYDPLHQRLFVQDDFENRITVFDVGTIHDGMEARAVMGQADFSASDNGSYNCNTPSATNQCDAEGQSEAYDAGNNRLYLSDSSDFRVLIFNFVTLTGNPPSGTLDVAYSRPVPTANNQGTQVYALAAGSLPPGLSLNTATGVISGTPTATGSYSFTVRVTDTLGATGSFDDTRPLSITIAAVPVPATGAGGGIAAGIALMVLGLGIAAAPMARRSRR